MKVRTAKGLLAWYMRRCGFRGWASFCNNPYEVEARAAEWKDS